MTLAEFLTDLFERNGVRDLAGMPSGAAATAIGLWAREHSGAIAGGLSNRPEQVAALAHTISDYYDAIACGDRNRANMLRSDIAEYHLQPARTGATQFITQWFEERARTHPDLVDQSRQRIP